MDNEACQVTSDACNPVVIVHGVTIDDSNDVREDRLTKDGRGKPSKGKNEDN